MYLVQMIGNLIYIPFLCSKCSFCNVHLFLVKTILLWRALLPSAQFALVAACQKKLQCFLLLAIVGNVNFLSFHWVISERLRSIITFCEAAEHWSNRTFRTYRANALSRYASERWKLPYISVRSKLCFELNCLRETFRWLIRAYRYCCNIGDSLASSKQQPL